jgi:hypothetical protein
MAEAAAHAAAIAQAIKASGVIVRLEPAEFLKILNRQDEPLVVQAHGGLFRSSWQYLTSYKGLAFFTKSAEQLLLPGRAQIVSAASIWIPG